MRTPRPAGRPKAISREMLEEAACELFLERGYEATSVADITRLAGVSRATFFNYVESKSGLLWASVDDVLARVEQEIAGGASALGGLAVAGAELKPGVAVLAIANAEAMGVGAELEISSAARQSRLASALREGIWGEGDLATDVWARAYAGAFFAAFESWAKGDPGVNPFEAELREALEVLA